MSKRRVLPCRYAFPGNIAELRDLVERAAVQAGEATTQLNADLFWFATQASLADRLCLAFRQHCASAVRMSGWPKCGKQARCCLAAWERSLCPSKAFMCCRGWLDCNGVAEVPVLMPRGGYRHSSAIAVANLGAPM